MGKHNPLRDKENASPPRHRAERARPATPSARPVKPPEADPADPRERSDQESIGRPVQLDEPPVSARWRTR